MSPRVDRRTAAAAGHTGKPYRCFAVCALGLETLVAAELRSPKIEARELAEEPGGVAFDATVDALYHANLHLRTSSRVLVRLGDFHVRALGELERRAKELAWERFIAPGRAVRLRVTCRKSRLYHSGAVAERIANAVAARSAGLSDSSNIGGGEGSAGLSDSSNIGGAERSAERSGERGAARIGAGESGEPTADDDVEVDESQLLVARVLHDRCTISIDSSGALLHRRGYRLATARAPLRETLAAALLLASEWNTRAPLIDPMCGSGTIAIEGALLARRIAPGLERSFGFEEWPEFDRALWDRALDEARSLVLPRALAVIQASDRDAGAIEAARANAERAGVASDIEFTRRALSAIEPPAEPGWLVTNPPYGLRVGESDRLRNLYTQLGHVIRAKCPGWTIALLSADSRLDSRIGIPLTTVLKTRNGGIAVRGGVGREGSRKHTAESRELPGKRKPETGNSELPRG